MMTYQEYMTAYDKLTADIQSALAQHLGKQAAKRLMSTGESTALSALKALDPDTGRRLSKALDELSAQARNVMLDTATEHARKALEARKRYEQALTRLGARFSSKGDTITITLLGNDYKFAIEGDKLTLIPKKPKGAKGPRRRKK